VGLDECQQLVEGGVDVVEAASDVIVCHRLVIVRSNRGHAY
jgi:hypothetical protein